MFLLCEKKKKKLKIIISDHFNKRYYNNCNASKLEIVRFCEDALSIQPCKATQYNITVKYSSNHAKFVEVKIVKFISGTNKPIFSENKT